MMHCYPFAFKAVFFKIQWLQVTWGMSPLDSIAWHTGINGHFAVVKSFKYSSICLRQIGVVEVMMMLMPCPVNSHFPLCW